jgi:hypothetical protein
MKFLLFLLFIFTQSFFFGQEVISKEDSLNTVRELEYKERAKELIRSFRENCSKDSLKAVSDSKVQNKYYISNVTPGGSDFPANKELEEDLRKNNIVWGGTWWGTDLAGRYSPNLCYYHFMNSFTEEKFGKDFIDGLVKQSLLKYIDKNRSIIFEYNDHLDWLYDGEYPIADSLLSKYFFEGVTYPKGYQSSKKNQPFTEVLLEFNYETYTLELKGFKHHIENNFNKQFIPYFEKRIKNFIKSSNFVLSEESGKYNGVKTFFKIYYK